MRYLKDAIATAAVVLLIPVLLMSFPVVLLVLAFRRVRWGIERRSWTAAARPSTEQRIAARPAAETIRAPAADVNAGLIAL